MISLAGLAASASVLAAARYLYCLMEMTMLKRANCMCLNMVGKGRFVLIGSPVFRAPQSQRRSPSEIGEAAPFQVKNQSNSEAA